MPMPRLPFVCLVAALLPAQDPIAPRAFLLDDHRHTMFADIKALRERGIWDDLEVSVLKLFFEMIEKQSAVKIAELDRVTMTAETPTQDIRTVKQVAVIENSKKLDLPESITRGIWKKDKIGAFEVHRHPQSDEVVVCPRPEVRVVGSASIVEPVLEGKPHTGQPCADIQSLLSGRGDNLVYLAIDVSGPVLQKAFLARLLPGVTWPEGDGPTFMLARVRAVGEADDPHLEVEGVLRHGKAGEGLAVTGKAVDEWLEKMKQDPQMRALQPLWPNLVRKVDRTDLVLRLDLGRSRDAVGMLAVLASPMLRPPGQDAKVKDAEAPVAPEKK